MAARGPMRGLWPCRAPARPERSGRARRGAMDSGDGASVTGPSRAPPQAACLDPIEPNSAAQVECRASETPDIICPADQYDCAIA